MIHSIMRHKQVANLSCTKIQNIYSILNHDLVKIYKKQDGIYCDER